MLSEKCLFQPAQKRLVLADIHLGKAGHFRKHGIPVPSSVHHRDLQLIEKMVDSLGAEQLLVLGDLYHSEANLEWIGWQVLLEKLGGVTVRLVVGNHDRWALGKLPKTLEISPETWVDGGLVFSHEPLPAEQIPAGTYNLCGHLHPSVRLLGKGGQALRLPCFWFGQQRGVLPAFGSFTGTAMVRPTTNDEVFVIAGKKVFRPAQQSFT